MHHAGCEERFGMDTHQSLNVRLSTRGKRSLRNLTPYDKVRAIQRIHNGETKASVSRDINVPESTLRGWCKNEQKLRFMCHETSPNFELENTQPAEKRKKFDVTNPFAMATQFLNRLPHLKSLDYINYSNGNKDDAILEEMSIAELIKRTPLSLSETANFNQSSCLDNNSGGWPKFNSNPLPTFDENSYKAISSKEASIGNPENSPALPMDHGFSNPKHKEPTSIENTSVVLQYWPHYSPKSSKNVSSNRSGPKMEVNGYNLLKTNCGDDVKNKNFSKQVPGASSENFNNTCTENNDSYRTSELTLLQWCTIFNTSLSCLALLANAATLQFPVSFSEGTNSNASDINPINNYCTESSASVLDKKPFPIQNDSYYESEPEDLSRRSTVSSKSTSAYSRSESPAKSITSNSSQSDADS